jgi:cellulose biosynthesis protein BcsQ
MTIPVIAFFNNKGGVGKTSLVYHLSWMLALMDKKVVVADLDPQANLTAAFLDDEECIDLWSDEGSRDTIYGGIDPLITRTGDIHGITPREISSNLILIPGDLELSKYEDLSSTEWNNCLNGQVGAFRVVSAFWRIAQNIANDYDADLVLFDLGPNLGAINRAALISSDFVVIPLAPDIYSLQGLRNLGPTLKKWRSDWAKRLAEKSDDTVPLPKGTISPVGYVVLQHTEHLKRPVKAYSHWIAEIPGTYEKEILHKPKKNTISVQNDPNCLAMLKHYRSLIPLGQEARKPIFSLTPADGAIGAHFQSSKNTYSDFESLAKKILSKIGIHLA